MESLLNEQAEPKKQQSEELSEDTLEHATGGWVWDGGHSTIPGQEMI